MDVTKTQRCRRCGQLKPHKGFSPSQRERADGMGTCRYCQMRLNNAWRWRSEQGYRGLPSTTRPIVDDLLQHSNMRLCYYCYSVMHEDNFTLSDPHECVHCEGKWLTEKKPKKEKKLSKLDQFIAVQEKRSTEMEEKFNALMNVMSRHVRTIEPSTIPPIGK